MTARRAPHPTPAATPTSVAPPARRGLVLAAVCLSAFAINIDTTIVNVALPSLTRQLHAGTTDLQWIVDGYSLAFSALVLAAGSLGDRYGRRPALLIGLVGFAVASGVGALCVNPGQLIAVRFLMGTFAALIFATTLSVITNAYPDRTQRAAAIGAWGAVTGLAVAVGPVTGGLLLQEFSWPSVFIALVPVALVAAVAVFAVVPESRDPATPPADGPGLLTASVAVGSLVYTIIEAPARGWASTPSVVGFAIAILSGIAFVLIERDSPHPMLDVKLFKTPAFSAASGSVTIAFFALFGFIFLITQYFQFIRGHGTLSTGVRILPVALSLGLFSVLGANFAARRGTRVIVCTGLVLLGGAFAWIAQTSATFPYPLIAVQMVMMGSALGLITTPATESILSVLPPAKAGSARLSTTPPASRRDARGRDHRQRLHLPLHHPVDLQHNRPAIRRVDRRAQLGRGRIRDRSPCSRADRPPADHTRSDRVLGRTARRLLCRCRRVRTRDLRSRRTARTSARSLARVGRARD